MHSPRVTGASAQAEPLASGRSFEIFRPEKARERSCPSKRTFADPSLQADFLMSQSPHALPPSLPASGAAFASLLPGIPDSRHHREKNDPPSVSSTSTPRSELQIPSLDGLRAVSFLIVFSAHLGFDKIIPGGFGVTVFFFLSGFLITTLLRVEHQKYGVINLRQFYLRRALRILPPFYLVLTFALALHAFGVAVDPLSTGAVVAQFLHYFNFWVITATAAGTPDGTVVYWSLAVEEHFYLLFPLGFIALQARWPGKWSRQGAVLLGVCALTLLWRSILVYGFNASSDRVYFGSDTRADSILFGCALALLANPTLNPERVASAIWRKLLPLAVTTLLFTFVFRAPWFRDTFRYTVQGLALIPIFIVAVRDPQWGVMRLLNHPVLRHVGVLSYSLYLLHLVIINALFNATTLPVWLVAPIALGLALAGAQVIHRLIERPCAVLRRRLTGARTATAFPFTPKGHLLPSPLPLPGVTSTSPVR
jgi:peptidoglycan/LPS O-acetylase OafA/YrhL